MCIATHFFTKTGQADLNFTGKKGIKTYTTIQTDELCKARGEKRARDTD